VLTKGVSVLLPDSTEGNPVNPCYDRLEAGSAIAVTATHKIIQTSLEVGSLSGRHSNQLSVKHYFTYISYRVAALRPNET